MNSRRRQALAAAMVRMSILLSVVIGLLSMLGTPLATAEPKHGGTLTVGLAADIAHFDVFHAIGYEAYWVSPSNVHLVLDFLGYNFRSRDVVTVFVGRSLCGFLLGTARMLLVTS